MLTVAAESLPRRCDCGESCGWWALAPRKTKRPATFAASPFDLAGGLGLRAHAPRWGRCCCAVSRNCNVTHRSRDVFEPRLTESESVVLPLDDPPKESLREFLQAAP